MGLQNHLDEEMPPFEVQGRNLNTNRSNAIGDNEEGNTSRWGCCINTLRGRTSTQGWLQKQRGAVGRTATWEGAR